MQILQSGPSAQTLRQRAMQEGFDQMAQGLSGVDKSIKDSQKTKRQEALMIGEARMKLQGQGYDTKHLSNEQLASGLGLSSGQPSGIMSIFGGKEQPSGAIDLYANRTQDYKDKIAQDAEDKRFKREGEEEDRRIKREELAIKKLEYGKRGTKDQLELMKMQNEQREKNLAMEVPGMGLARTKEEASNIRAAKADADEALGIIDQIKNLGTNVSIFDRDRVGKINQLKTVLAGKLRLPLTGPGAMTEDEFQRLVSNIGDPSAVFGTEENEMAKLDQLKDILGRSVESKFATASATPFKAKSTWSGDSTPEVKLSNVGFRGQAPSIPFAPTNINGPISNAVAGDLKSVDTNSLASRREQLMQKAAAAKGRR